MTDLIQYCLLLIKKHKAYCEWRWAKLKNEKARKFKRQRLNPKSRQSPRKGNKSRNHYIFIYLCFLTLNDKIIFFENALFFVFQFLFQYKELIETKVHGPHYSSSVSAGFWMGQCNFYHCDWCFCPLHVILIH